ncbi:MAG: hypothetical protein IIA59_06975 [Candidatus Marinimicrobia bacterium]|nr:hypothetical protein [Candidatus Neomarinimicrobiota bacterium]
MKRSRPLSTVLLILGIMTHPLSGQNDDEQSERSSKRRGFLPDTRFFGISNRYYDDLTGLQLGLASNMVQGDLTGLQLAGLANVTGGRMGGLQAAGLANVAGQSALGGQVSLLANVAGGAAGVQLTGLANVAAGGALLQAAGLTNVAAEAFTWGQFSGLVNVAAGGSAVQLSGLANISASESSLFQVTGLANVAQGDVVVQAAGLVNVAGGSAWSQLGIINVTPEARLLQIGVLNVAAKNSGLPLGVINFIGDNPLRFSIMVDGYGQATTAVRSGNRHIYSVAGFQGDKDVSLDRLGSMLLGLGLNLPLNRAYLAVEYLHNQRVNALNQRAAAVGLRAGFRVAMDMALVAGTSVRWDDLTTGDAAGNLSNGWSIGLEWFRYFDVGDTSRDLGIDFDDF